MGKLTVDSNRNNNDSEPYDCELKSLIDKCNVCHSNLSSFDGEKFCRQHNVNDGEI